MNFAFIQQHIWFFAILALWEIAWKGVALWKAAQKGEKTWFVAILLINSVGVLPIFYLYFFQKNKKGSFGFLRI